MNTDLSGRNAMVLGASKGIGKAVAQSLAESGATVTGLARSEAELHDLSRALPAEKGQDHDYLVSDFNKLKSFEKNLVAYLGKNSKTIHILVNNSGGPPPGNLHEAENEDLLRGFNMHILNFQTVLRAVLPDMKDAGYGRIINITSTSVKSPIDGLGVSNTIRGAVSSWSKTLSRELGQFGITVNNILPGFTRTERLHELIELWAKERGKTEAEIIASMQSTIPAKRFAEPEEIGSAIAFLASPAASYINGINLLVDGGRTNAF